MSADNYLLIRPYNDGWLVTDEKLSAPHASNAAEKFAEVTSPDCLWHEGWFEEFRAAEDFVDAVYELNADRAWPEYGPQYVLS